MDAALLFFGFLWALLGGKDRGAAPGRPAPAPQRPAPALPPSAAPESPRVSTERPPPAPWPSVLPSGLPPFPGPDWVYDEPPPVAVQQRAGQLVKPLWARGAGSYQVEQTAGRWIAYKAAIVASGKRGVVAYRVRSAAPAPRAPAPRAPAPRAPGPPQTAARPAPAPPAVVVLPNPAQPSGAFSLPTLRRGWGIKPAPPHKDVVLLQQKLGITADGRFGPGTETAVMTFQRRNGLVADGIVGAKTWTALYAVRA